MGHGVCAVLVMGREQCGSLQLNRAVLKLEMDIGILA